MQVSKFFTVVPFWREVQSTEVVVGYAANSNPAYKSMIVIDQSRVAEFISHVCEDEEHAPNKEYYEEVAATNVKDLVDMIAGMLNSSIDALVIGEIGEERFVELYEKEDSDEDLIKDLLPMLYIYEEAPDESDVLISYGNEWLQCRGDALEIVRDKHHRLCNAATTSEVISTLAVSGVNIKEMLTNSYPDHIIRKPEPEESPLDSIDDLLGDLGSVEQQIKEPEIKIDELKDFKEYVTETNKAMEALKGTLEELNTKMNGSHAAFLSVFNPDGTFVGFNNRENLREILTSIKQLDDSVDLGRLDPSVVLDDEQVEKAVQVVESFDPKVFTDFVSHYLKHSADYTERAYISGFIGRFVGWVKEEAYAAER